ncbi:MAG: S8 family serine peptidase, partial [Bacteroidales bacterium]|nr:S8 family serine peptidase [Bacteroidales bacterium]
IKGADSISISKINTFNFVSKVEKVYDYSLILKKNKKYSNKDLNVDFESIKQGSEKYKGLSKINSTQIIIEENQNFGYSFEQNNVIGIDYLHNCGFKGTGVDIAVLDAGYINADKLQIFDSLFQRNRIKGFKDFDDVGKTVFNSSLHGTMVLSVMGGNIPGIYYGAAPCSNYWLLRTENALSEFIVEEDNWIAAAEYADSIGADIINSSLGYTVFDDSTQSYKYKDMDGKTARISKAADIAVAKGLFVVNSAGNSGAYEWKYIGAPADAQGVVSVGAIDLKRRLASFSSVGPTFDGRIKPDLVAPGLGVAASNYNNDIISVNGTSFSSPILAAGVACLMQAFPDKTNVEINKALKESASKAFNPDFNYGYGIVNFAAAFKILSGKEININMDNFMISPNPFSENISIIIHSYDSSEVVIDIYDINGKKVYNTNNVYKLKGYTYILLKDLETLSNGLYYLTITSNNSFVKRKLMKIN